MKFRDKYTQATIQHFEVTLKMLNESMGMCLPTTLTIKRGSPGGDPSHGPDTGQLENSEDFT